MTIRGIILATAIVAIHLSVLKAIRADISFHTGIVIACLLVVVHGVSAVFAGCFDVKFVWHSVVQVAVALIIMIAIVNRLVEVRLEGIQLMSDPSAIRVIIP